ncbi:MAG: excinuclease ABC subunit UvrA, partial [Candidatus Parcubacteria bacterium]|nr:excinuclease ABC subunit UvrA [Candidatus Parcubacteria bacterium]
MQNEFIKIRGARVHNLKNIDLDLPKNKLIVITGLSGSGKSSLAFDTLYAEGQRRYVESLSAYARQFLGVMDKPDVDKIEGISPAISIDQRKSTHNPRSTVGTITEIYDYLRLLYARSGKPHCPTCGKLISRQPIDQIVEQVLKIKSGSEITILGPVIRDKKGEHHAVLEEIQRGGFVRVRIDGIIYQIEESLQKQLDKQKKHGIEVVVDRLVLDKELDRSRLVDSLEIALRVGKGIVIVGQKNDPEKDLIFSEHFACEDCGISLPELEPRLFSFNNPYGACPECTGLGEKLEVDPELVIPNKRLTLSEGAIWPWSRASHKVGRQGYYYSILSGLASKYNFSLDEEVKDLPKKVIDIILYGDGSSPTNFGQKGVAGGVAGKEHSPKLVGDKFEGVVANLERRYHETDSDWTRQEIEQYMVIKICPKCHGKRLKPEVLAVTVGDQSIDKVVDLPVDKVKEFFSALGGPASCGEGLKASELKICSPILKEIIDRTQFLNDVGLSYLTLSRKAGTLAGGEEQRIRLATQ